MHSGFSVAVAVAKAGSYSSDSTLAWELPYATGAALKRKNKIRRKKKKIHFCKVVNIWVSVS